MYAAPPIHEDLFPRAAAYRKLIHPDELNETPARYFPYSERHLQALWYDDRLRPPALKTSRGEAVTVENPGRWNLEAGPDFAGAVLLIGRERRRVCGDAEVHISPADWKHHGHAADPRYSNVRFHITWFAGGEKIFPDNSIHIVLGETCAADLESIDTGAYPYQQPNARRRFPALGTTPDEITGVLEAAGEERLRQKTRRIAWLISERGGAPALYEETAGALGYKYNKAPFRQLARKLPLAALNERYGADWQTVYAVLLGLSGLLPKQPAAGWTAESKEELRRLWDCWWREEQRWEDVAPVNKKEWRLAGVRPLNHPVRRLCALAQWIAGGAFENAALFTSFQKSFWSNHTGWTGKETPAELAGKDRLNAIELNVLVPYRLANGDSSALKNLPAEPLNSIIRETAAALFGADHSPKLYRTALARQGLIQLFNDLIAGR